MDTRELFVKHGLRCTKQRIAIYEILAQSRSHPTAEELFADVRGGCDGLSLATVYNTVEALCDAGLCRKLPTARGSARYDADLSPHLHVIDETTGNVTDVPTGLGHHLLNGVTQQVIDEIESRTGLTIDHVSVHFHTVAASANGHQAI